MESNPVTLVLGASEKTDRYSNMAVRRLQSHGHKVIAVGNKTGKIDDVPIVTETKQLGPIDTITLYLNPSRQKQYYDLILDLQPRRVIFNPGTENPELKKMLKGKNIEPIEACTLVMLSTGQF